MIEYIGYGVGVVGVGFTILSTGIQIGKNKNNKNGGYVKSKDCDHKHELATNKQDAIHDKINAVALDVAAIKGMLKKDL